MLTVPIELLKERLEEIKLIEKHLILNNNLQDLPEVKRFRLMYSISIKTLESIHSKYELELGYYPINQKKTVLNKAKILEIKRYHKKGLSPRRKYSTGYYAKKFNVSITTINKAIRHDIF